MTLRNAFQDLGTEAMLRKILRAVSYAKDPNDRLYVSVTNQPTVSVGAANNTGAALTSIFLPPYHQSSWNAHDIRQEYAEMTHQSFQATRSRWTIT